MKGDAKAAKEAGLHSLRNPITDPPEPDEVIKLLTKIAIERNTAERKAFLALAGYKFFMFGYWAAAWVKYNALLPKSMKVGSPFKSLVTCARRELGQEE